MTGITEHILNRVIRIMPNNLTYEETACEIAFLLNVYLNNKEWCSRSGSGKWKVELVYCDESGNIYVKVYSEVNGNREEKPVEMFKYLVEEVYEQYQEKYPSIVDYVLKETGLYKTLVYSRDLEWSITKRYYKKFVSGLVNARLAYFTTVMVEHFTRYYDYYKGVICDIDEALEGMKKDALYI